MFFRTSPVPFTLEGAPPLPVAPLLRRGANRSSCRSYIKVPSGHQSPGVKFFIGCAVREEQNGGTGTCFTNNRSQQ